MTPASAPAAPKDTVNLVEGKTITASIDPVRAADLAKSGDANWFAQQRYPQWFSVDLGAPAEFDLHSGSPQSHVLPAIAWTGITPSPSAA